MTDDRANPATDPLLRSCLSVPALQARFVERAATAPADAIAFDLEDSIAPADKAEARAALARALPGFPARGRLLLVRPNGLDTGLLEADLDAVVGPSLDAVFLPKVHGPEHVRTVDAYLGYLERTRGLPDGSVRLVVWIESTAGLAAAEAICRASGRLLAAAFGAEDYVTDLGVPRTRTSEEVAYARSRVANAAVAAGLVPLDCPEPDYRDLDHFERDSRRARALGYRGKFCIHPSQLPVANRVFAPAAAEVAWARRVVGAYEDGLRRGLGAVGLEGAMVDRPVYLRAARLVALDARVRASGVCEYP